jgi:hypothetical protein
MARRPARSSSRFRLKWVQSNSARTSRRSHPVRQGIPGRVFHIGYPAVEDTSEFYFFLRTTLLRRKEL